MNDNPLLRLETGQIDVWLTSLHDVGGELQCAYLRLLSEEERARWARFVAPDARIQYLVSRVLVRTTLSRYAEVSEHAWQFEANRYGRPYVSQPRAWRDIYFNLSNTTGLVVCAVCGPPVAGSIISSQLPWSAVMSNRAPAFSADASTRFTHSSTV